MAAVIRKLISTKTNCPHAKIAVLPPSVSENFSVDRLLPLPSSRPSSGFTKLALIWSTKTLAWVPIMKPMAKPTTPWVRRNSTKPPNCWRVLSRALLATTLCLGTARSPGRLLGLFSATIYPISTPLILRSSLPV